MGIAIPLPLSIGELARPPADSPGSGSGNLVTIATIVVATLLAALSTIRKLLQRRRLPPGPTGLPIVGSFPFLTHYPELTLDRWAKTYGDLYSMYLGNQLFVVVSSPDIAKDLFVTNGAIFSSRKQMFVKCQTVMHGRGITTTPYGDRWRKHRRIANSWLNQKAVDKYMPRLDMEATDMVRCLLAAGKNGTVPVNPQPFAGRCSLNNMLTHLFGIRTASVDDPLVHKALAISREFMNITGPMSNLVDFVPLLQYLPNSLATRGDRLHKSLISTYGGMVKAMERDMQAGKPAPECLSKVLIETREKEGLDELDEAMIVSAFMIGGVETTASVMQWFMAIIPSYPAIQRRAQAELDSVVGRDRLPTAADQARLPYCRAIVKEVERCHNPFWLGTPHMSTADFTYRGEFIPKGTVLVTNTWSMHHDPARYPSPDAFNPDRYLDDPLSSADSAKLADPHQRDHWTFGVGRRMCPAIPLAECEIWLAVSRLLWAFDMSALPGKPIDLAEYDGLSGRSPVPFEIYLRPRHERVEEVLAAAAAETGVQVDVHGGA